MSRRAAFSFGILDDGTPFDQRTLNDIVTLTSDCAKAVRALGFEAILYDAASSYPESARAPRWALHVCNVLADVPDAARLARAVVQRCQADEEFKCALWTMTQLGRSALVLDWLAETFNPSTDAGG